MKKEIILISGANGSGKTTFAKLYSKKLNLPFVNADEIAKTLKSENGRTKDFKAGELFYEQIRELSNNENSFIIESTLAGKSLIHHISKLKSMGYSILIIYLFLESPELCIERIKERVLKGGHNVADSDVIRRYNRSKNNFWNIFRPMADQWYLIHNSKQLFDRISMGSGKDYVIKNNHLFDLFKKNVIIEQ